MLAEYQMQVQYILVSRNYGVLCNFASLETIRKYKTQSGQSYLAHLQFVKTSKTKHMYLSENRLIQAKSSVKCA